MKHPRHRLSIEPVANSYTPGYPRSLTPAEFRALVEPRLRLRRAALSATLAFSAVACESRQQDVPAPVDEPQKVVASSNLEKQVLAIITELHQRGNGFGWYSYTRFSREPLSEENEDRRRPSVSPQIPISFGNSLSGVFDSELARRTALDLFRAYGLNPATDFSFLGDGFEATVDGYDEASGLGFEMRGGAPDSEVHDNPFGGGSMTPDPEHDSDYLDDEEIERVRAAGHLIHVADQQLHYDGDNFTPILSHLAGLVDFLNAHTDGPDLDLSAILWQEKQRLYLPQGLVDSPPSEAQGSIGRTFHEPTTMTLEFNGPDRGAVTIASGMQDSWTEAWKSIDAPLSTAGVPTVISMYIYPNDDRIRRRSMPLRRLVQEPDGGTTIKVESHASEMFLPSAFDGARPFRIELEFQPGSYDIGRYILVGAPSP